MALTTKQHLRVLACVIVMGCIVGYVINAQEIETDSPYIDYIQAQSFPSSEIPIYDCLHRYYENPYWEYFTTQNGKHVVQFTGTNQSEQIVLQFVVAKDRASFELGAMKQNDVVLTKEEKLDYIKQLLKAVSNS